MNERIKLLHEKNVSLFSKFREYEGRLLDSLQEFDAARGVEYLGYASLFKYCVEGLGMSEGQAFTFIRVSRKSVEVPELKIAVQEKSLSITNARVISSIITKENKETWLQKAITLPKAQLEREIAKENPKAAKPDRLIPLDASQSLASGVLSERARKILERVKELESKRTSKNCDLDSAIIAMGSLYLKKNDPIEKAKRNLPNSTQVQSSARKTKMILAKSEYHEKSNRSIPANISHQVSQRDRGICRVQGCGSRYFTQSHHIRPFSRGGRHTLDNLVTLCAGHHRAVHRGVNLVFEVSRASLIN